MSAPVDLNSVLATVDQPWTPRTVAVLNDYDVRVVKTRGEFTRHSHPETDEVVLVLDSSLTIRVDDGDVTLGPGQAVRRTARRPAPAGVRRQRARRAGRAERDGEHRRHPECADR